MAWCSSHRLNGAESQGESPIRAAVYIDGFNLYHPIDDAGEHHLKWACLKRMGELFCQKDGHSLEKVVFCTAVPAHLPEKRDRHNIFNAAQRARGVIVMHGHHVFEPDKDKYAEKQSDINVALSLIVDGIDDVYDVAYLVSADSDQVATARAFTERLATLGKQLIGVAPLGRSVPVGYKKYGIKGFALTKYQLEQCVMPELVQGKSGMIVRPTNYAPPSGWVHPDNRPTGKPPKIAAGTKWTKAAKG